jgi:hypothetical protein
MPCTNISLVSSVVVLLSPADLPLSPDVVLESSRDRATTLFVTQRIPMMKLRAPYFARPKGLAQWGS